MKIFAKLVLLSMAVSSVGGALASAQSVQAVCASNPYDPNPTCNTNSSYNNGNGTNSGSAYSAVKYPELCSVLTRTLKVGDQGADVKSLQIVLGQEGIAYLGGTGYFGTVTERAVKVFQSRAGIYAVGKVGPQTLARMRALWCGPGTAVDNNNNGNTGSVVALNLTPTNSSTNALTLTWTTRNAVSCTINNQQVPVNGTQNYSIYQETEYTIACVDSQNRVARKTILARPIATGGNLPQVSMSINPTNAVVGTYATIYWSSTNTNSCSLNGQVVPTVGTQQVYIQSTNSSYTIVCTNSTGQTVTQSVNSYGNGTGGNNTQSGLQLSLTTNRTNYAIGDTLVANVVVQNNSNTQATYQEPICTLYGPFSLTINGSDFYNFLESNARAVCLAYGNSTIILQPYESKTYTYTAIIANKSFPTTSLNLQANLTNNTTSYQGSANAYFTINGNGGTSNDQVSINTSSASTGNNTTINYNNTLYTNAQGALFELINSTGGVVGTITRLPNSVTTSLTNGSFSWTIPKSIVDTRNDAISCQTINGESLCGNVIYTGQYKVRATYFTPSNYCFGYCAYNGGQILGYSESSVFTINSTVGTNSGSITATLSANPTNITYSGQPTTLSWSSTNATYCNISGGNTNLSSQPTSGSYTVYPTANTTYIINCYNSNNQVGQGSVVVTLNGANGTTPTVTVTPNVVTIASGQSTNLTVTTTNVSYCLSSWNGGSEYVFLGNTSTNFSKVYPISSIVSPIINFNCTGFNGQTVSTSVTVNGTNTGTNVINSFYGSNSSGNVALNWTGTGSNTCNVYRYTALGPNGEYYYDSNKSLIASSQPVTGNFAIAYSATTNQGFELFTLDCGGVKSNAIVYSNTNVGTPTLSITPTTATVARGSSATFTIASNNVASCFNNRQTTNKQLFVLNGQFSLTPDFTTVYDFECNGTNGSSTYSTVTVNVTNSPTYSTTLQANVATTSARNVKLTLNSTNASCNENTTEVGSVDFGDGSRPSYSFGGCFIELNYTYFGSGLYYVRRYVGNTLLGTYNLIVN